ncbi:MAG: hypothetical protein E6X18_00270 [Atopobium minutum]|uniref:Uncharacterized protein n=2 Tax=Atopobium minutum TaxID=1381 RepID=N2BVL6_9ACTN|nr:hypothetical protein [Atopobium minutum]EMZ42620.1 hypothetical protein HMPREF1091_00178 [Atopobium minutum 10063974]ERL15493.1 hypothetical protein HMPREF1247_0868 [Atopobium sp. BV3Ac4]MDU4969451.1 hypothetical protein [Atopobium minutum]
MLQEEDNKQAQPDLQEERVEDFTNFDVLAAVAQAGITTICLDEAHHLRAEW